MPLAFFTVPVQSPESAASELNGFWASHKVLSVERRWVDLGWNSFWAVCVDFLPAGVSGPGGKFSSGRARIDYKEVLSPDEFTVFSQLREIRKEISQVEAEPVYTVFTNAVWRWRTRSHLAGVQGMPPSSRRQHLPTGVFVR